MEGEANITHDLDYLWSVDICWRPKKPVLPIMQEAIALVGTAVNKRDGSSKPADTEWTHCDGEWYVLCVGRPYVKARQTTLTVSNTSDSVHSEHRVCVHHLTAASTMEFAHDWQLELHANHNSSLSRIVTFRGETQPTDRQNLYRTTGTSNFRYLSITAVDSA